MTPDSTLIQLLAQAGLPSAGCRVEAMAGGGSDRRMSRIHLEDGRRVVRVENPSPQNFGGPLTENDSFAYVAGLLSDAGELGPRLLAYDGERGTYLVEDLGERHLLDVVREAGSDRERLRAAYEAVLDDLVAMQAALRGRFDAARVYNAPYDRELMRVWESGYCVERFFKGLLELPLDFAALGRELDGFADRAATIEGGLFLYRDFQSTNVMRHEGRWRYIDFQGGRLGPPHYDAASLLLDPYARLPKPLRDELLARHAGRLQDALGRDADAFLADFPLIAAHRMLQALGAYGLLSRVKGKWSFLDHVPTAMRHLGELLDEPALAGLVRLRRAWDAANGALDAGALERLRAEAGA